MSHDLDYQNELFFRFTSMQRQATRANRPHVLDVVVLSNFRLSLVDRPHSNSSPLKNSIDNYDNLTYMSVLETSSIEGKELGLHLDTVKYWPRTIHGLPPSMSR